MELMEFFSDFLYGFSNNRSKNNSPDMNSNEEEEEIATDSMYSIDELDPLADPLALDDDLGDRALDSGNGFSTRHTNLSDLDSSDDGQIILVDVNSLKNSFTIPASYGASSLEIVPSTQTSSRRNSNEAGLTCGTNANTSIGIGDVTFDPIVLTLDDEITEEVEGSRSDGSDSGLGLELCAGLLNDKLTTSPNGKEIELLNFFTKNKVEFVLKTKSVESKKGKN